MDGDEYLFTPEVARMFRDHARHIVDNMSKLSELTKECEANANAIEGECTHIDDTPQLGLDRD